MTPSKDISRLLEIMAALRTSVTGCPWDLEQTFASIAPYTIEEAYEVADAIERNAMDELRDELGDLLLQVVYHSRMAEEQQSFAFGDVVEAVTTKMIRRHPHVFGTEDERSKGAEKGFWDRVKAAEKASRPAKTGFLDDIPANLPGLTRAIKLQHAAAKVGFDWPDLTPVFDKLEEEIGELKEVVLPSDAQARNTDETRTRAEEELGDLLFVIANIARHLEIDPERALRGANQKFTRRFAHIEARLAETGRTPAQSSLEEMDRFWDEARARDKSPAK